MELYVLESGSSQWRGVVLTFQQTTILGVFTDIDIARKKMQLWFEKYSDGVVNLKKTDNGLRWGDDNWKNFLIIRKFKENGCSGIDW